MWASEIFGNLFCNLFTSFLSLRCSAALIFLLNFRCFLNRWIEWVHLLLNAPKNGDGWLMSQKLDILIVIEDTCIASNTFRNSRMNSLINAQLSNTKPSNFSKVMPDRIGHYLKLLRDNWSLLNDCVLVKYLELQFYPNLSCEIQCDSRLYLFLLVRLRHFKPS